MKSKIEIGNKVNGKYGIGTISQIITKSTGYVQITWESGKVSKEMAFNLTDESGSALKSKPSNSTNGKSYASDIPAKMKYALEQELGRTGLSVNTMLRMR